MWPNRDSNQDSADKNVLRYRWATIFLVFFGKTKFRFILTFHQKKKTFARKTRNFCPPSGHISDTTRVFRHCVGLQPSWGNHSRSAGHSPMKNGCVHGHALLHRIAHSAFRLSLRTPDSAERRTLIHCPHAHFAALQRKSLSPSIGKTPSGFSLATLFLPLKP